MGHCLSNCGTTVRDHAVYTFHFYSKNMSHFEGEKQAESEEKQKKTSYFYISLHFSSK
jgi:hypothetical protein